MGEEEIDYRLSNIEKALSELKNVVIDNKLQSRDIRDLQKKVEEFLAAINAHEKRLRNIEIAPQKEKAERWGLAIDNVIKAVMAACLAIILARVGLK